MAQGKPRKTKERLGFGGSQPWGSTARTGRLWGMPVNLIRDADVHAISIVGKGANRKRFFLFKSEPEEKADHIATGRLLKEDGQWSAAYVVVAEPGWHESPGSAPGTDQTIEDRWDEDEIRKAAHRFMANGALVNKMHESMEPYGQLVENAVALADFTVGSETIRKGAWYIAIAPTEEGREAIDKGEFTGVSIEGAAVRELVEKGSTGDEHSVRAMEKIAPEREAAQLAEAIAKRLVPQQPAAPAATAAPALDAGAIANAIADKVGEVVAELFAPNASTAGPGWDEGIHHILSDIFGPTPAENATSIESLSKCDDETLSAAIAELVPESPGPEAILKAYEAEGVSPGLVGIFG